MSLGSLAVRRAITTSMLYIAVIGFGLYALTRLPMNRLPEVELPVIAVITTYTGASPFDMETLVTEPIERAVSSVENVEEVQSTSRQGISIVLISFGWGTDMNAAEVEVRKNIDLFAGDLLPNEATKPLSFAFDPSLSPVAFFAIEGPGDGHRLRTIGRDLVQPYLGRVEGVAAAEVIGGRGREIKVLLDGASLTALEITPREVVEALRAGNLVTPAGAVDGPVQQLNLEPTGLYRTTDEVRRTVVGQRGGRAVVLDEVADVEDGYEDETHVVTIDGSPAVLLAVRKQSDANTVETVRAIRDALPAIEKRLPEGVRLVSLFDEAEPIERAIANLGYTGLQAFLLTGLVLLLFLRDARTSLIAVVAVPVSILVAFVAMDLLGVTLNLFSMAGLALAIGMLVDNGIVVLEATHQAIERGRSPAAAALGAVEEMSLPLFASTLTTVVVFLPILLVEGIAGELFRDLILTITVTLLSSLVVAISLVPLLASRWLGRGRRPWAERLARATAFLDEIPHLYASALSRVLTRPKLAVASAFAVFVASLAVVPVLGQDFIPAADVSQVRAEVIAAPGTSLERMRKYVARVESAIREQVTEAEIISADYGQAEGFSALFGSSANRAVIRVKLPPRAERNRSQQQIEAELTRRFRDIPGMDVQISAFSLSGGNGDIRIKLFGEDLDRLRVEGERVREAMTKVEGVREARFTLVRGSPELSLAFDRERMRILRVPPAEVADTVATHYQGVIATFFRRDGDELPIRVRSPHSARSDLDRLRYLPIRMATGATLPLSSVVSFDDRLGPLDIDHEDQRRYAAVELTAEGLDLGGLVDRVEKVLERIDLHPSLQVEVGGTAEDLRDAFFKLVVALAAALALVYMVMASQFESLREPFVIMFTVPLAACGVVLALLLTGTTVQVTALVGVILLGGVVVNNGIVLIDAIKRRIEAGVDPVDATIAAGRARVRPILITALTTILGMVPLSLGFGDGAETWAPMARAVVGGMIASTALTLFVVPALYLILRRRPARTPIEV